MPVYFDPPAVCFVPILAAVPANNRVIRAASGDVCADGNSSGQRFRWNLMFIHVMPSFLERVVCVFPAIHRHLEVLLWLATWTIWSSRSSLIL